MKNSSTTKASHEQNGGRNKEQSSRKKPPILKLSSFTDPREPWVLVPEGSFMNYFDWVPKKLRVGPWSKLAAPTLLIISAGIVYLRPTEKDDFDSLVSSYPKPLSLFWWYNAVAFLGMGIVLYRCIANSAPAIMIAYTMLSWFLNMSRHAINALAPFLSDHHFLLRLNHITRFPALLTATITFLVWNFALLPFVYIVAMNSKQKRIGFIAWNFNLNMVQLHCCNIFYAIMNTLITGPRNEDIAAIFDKDDLWYALAYSLTYGLFYNLILDRIGIHLYPIFSPRSRFLVITWSLVFALHYAAYLCWNIALSDYRRFISFEIVVCAYFSTMIIGGVIHHIFSRKKEQLEKKE